MLDIDPKWTEKADYGRILDPLELNRVRNRILDHLLFGIVSIAITQRLRYISFSLWCLNNLDNPTKSDIVPFEKIFLLSNLAHDHEDEKDRSEKGLSGKDNVPWTKEDLRNSSGKSFRISSEEFEIQKGNSTAFSQYYRGLMHRLLLVEEGFNPTPLGEKIAEAFDQSVDVDFSELEDAADKERVPQELLLRFADDGCCCEISNNERELITKAYLGLVASSMRSSNLAFTSTENAESFNLDALISEEASDIEDILEETSSDVDKYLDKFFSTQAGTKMRESILLFLSIAARRSDEFNTETPDWGGHQDIRRLWRTLRFYDYFVYACESLLFATLWTLRIEGPTYPKNLLNMIIEHTSFGKAVHDSVNSIVRINEDQDSNGLDEIFQHIYYDELTMQKTVIDVENTGNSFQGTWHELQSQVNDRINLSKFLMDDKTSEWKIKRLIDQEVSNPSGNHLETGSRIFGYATALLAVLKLRYEHFFSSESYDRYWKWVEQVEGTSPGPVKIFDSLKDEGDLDGFIKEFAYRWVIRQHNKAVYNKMDSSRMPRLFSQDFTGQIDFQHSDYVDGWSSSLSSLKFKRMADILYELDLVKGDDFDHFRITEKGKSLINRFCEVLS